MREHVWRSSYKNELEDVVRGAQDLRHYLIKENRVAGMTRREGRGEREGATDQLRTTKQIVTVAEDLTKITGAIASLNQKVLQAEIGGYQKANDLRDQRNNMIRELSSHMDISYYEDKDGMVTIRGPAEALLVDRNGAAGVSIKSNQENQGMGNLIKKMNVRIITNSQIMK